ncbi:hypothetical protein PY365_08540 [Roseiarcaceae bacterium H3SJ34-1]|nr:hypothetical protein [Roseiarcaceae bacterium H3SJ34-1]
MTSIKDIPEISSLFATAKEFTIGGRRAGRLHEQDIFIDLNNQNT